MARPGADQWLQETFDLDTSTLRQATPGGGGGGGGTATADPSADELMKRAAAKAKQEADAAATDARAKSADADAKRQTAASARQDAEAKYAAEAEIEAAEAAERDADKLGGATPSSPSDPSSAELLKQAEAKAKQEADEAGARFKAAGDASNQADDASKAAKALADAKAKAAAEVEAAAAAEHKAAGGPADAAKKLPRPMESDCKPVSGKMPDAPDDIQLCATHGHVVDTTKKLIVAETPDAWRRAHPRAKPAPAAAPAAPAAPTAAETVPAKRSLDKLPPDRIIGSTTLSIDAQGDIREVLVSVNMRANGDVECSMSWRYADTPAGDTPAAVHEELRVSWEVLEEVGTVHGPSHKVELDKEYKIKGKLKTRPRDEGHYRVHAQIVSEGADTPLLELAGELQVNFPER
jgi:hypothetical protein